MIKIVSSILKSILALFFNAEGLFKQIRGKHKGEECYIFGDGLSLKYMDLSFFSDKPAIACNNFIFHKDFKKVDLPNIYLEKGPLEIKLKKQAREDAPGVDFKMLVLSSLIDL